MRFWNYTRKQSANARPSRINFGLVYAIRPPCPLRSTKSTPSTYPEIAVNAILVLIAGAYSLLDRQLTFVLLPQSPSRLGPDSFPFFLDIYNNSSMMLLLAIGNRSFGLPKPQLIEFFSSGFGKAEIAVASPRRMPKSAL